MRESPIEWARRVLAANPAPLTDEERRNLIRYWGEVAPPEGRDESVA